MVDAVKRFLTPGRRKAAYKILWIVAGFAATKGAIDGDTQQFIGELLAVGGFAVADAHTVKENTE